MQSLRDELILRTTKQSVYSHGHEQRMQYVQIEINFTQKFSTHASLPLYLEWERTPLW